MESVKQHDCMIDAGGEQFPVSSLKPWDIPVAMCCPCCLGNPCASHRRQWLFSQLTYFLSGVVILQIFIFFMEIGNAQIGQLFHVPNDVLISFGAMDTRLVKDGQFLRVLVAIFLHPGLFHLAINVLGMVFYGIPLERQWGWRRTAAIFFISGLAGNILSAVFSPSTISVGGATCLFGLIGANTCQLICGWHLMSGPERKVTTLTVIIYFTILSLFSAAFENHLMSHLGGFVGGFLMGSVFFAHLCEMSALKHVLPVWGGIILFAYFAGTVGHLVQA